MLTSRTESAAALCGAELLTCCFCTSGFLPGHSCSEPWQKDTFDDRTVRKCEAFSHQSKQMHTAVKYDCDWNVQIKLS